MAQPKTTLMESIAVFFIKRFSNLFWEIADSWSYKNEKIARMYDRSIGNEYRKEYETCGVAADAKIVHIGCGAYPLTEIILAHCAMGPIVGIDKNPRTVSRAQQVIRKRQLQDRISIVHGDGLTYPVSDVDVIIVSSCSLQKPQILQHLFKNAKPQCTIVVREVDIATSEILHCITEHPIITIEKQVRHNPFPFFEPIGWTTFCLKKK